MRVEYSSTPSVFESVIARYHSCCALVIVEYQYRFLLTLASVCPSLVQHQSRWTFASSVPFSLGSGYRRSAVPTHTEPQFIVASVPILTVARVCSSVVSAVQLLQNFPRFCTILTELSLSQKLSTYSYCAICIRHSATHTGASSCVSGVLASRKSVSIALHPASVRP